MRVVDYQCQQILKAHYHRVCPVTTPPIALDDYRKTAVLVALGETTPLDETAQWLQTYWM
ncbi:MAG: hypothetical protein IPM39_06350 [Chloroflexi bacterium]|nr:hypothetical protein [Chloroflexota bacterium]